MWRHECAVVGLHRKATGCVMCSSASSVMVGPVADGESAPGRPGVWPALMLAVSVPASRHAFSGDRTPWRPMVTRQDCPPARVCTHVDLRPRGIDPDVAARRGEASVLYSEDLNHGQTFGSVQVLNPFLESEL